MSSVEIKKELKRLIERESNQDILKAIHTILNRSVAEEEVLREKLTSRAQRSNEDISKDKLMDRKSVEEQTEDLL